MSEAFSRRRRFDGVWLQRGVVVICENERLTGADRIETRLSTRAAMLLVSFSVQSDASGIPAREFPRRRGS